MLIDHLRCQYRGGEVCDNIASCDGDLCRDCYLDQLTEERHRDFVSKSLDEHLAECETERLENLEQLSYGSVL